MSRKTEVHWKPLAPRPHYEIWLVVDERENVRGEVVAIAYEEVAANLIADALDRDDWKDEQDI